jgi:hypothetical protein
MSDWEPSINDAMQQWPRSDSEIIAPPLPEVPIGVADDVTSDDEALDFAVEPGGDQESYADNDAPGLGIDDALVAGDEVEVADEVGSGEATADVPAAQEVVPEPHVVGGIPVRAVVTHDSRREGLHEPKDVPIDAARPDSKAKQPAEQTPIRNPDWPPSEREHRLLAPDMTDLDPTEHPDLAPVRREVVFPRESPLTATERRMVRGIVETAVVVGDRLGVDLRGRAPDETRLHMFDNKDDFMMVKLREYGEEVDNGAIRTSDAGILCTRSADEVEQIALLTHEIWHELAKETARSFSATGQLVINGRVIPPVHIESGYSGYSIGGNEVVTDMLTMESFKLMGIDSANLSYRYHDMTFDSELRRAAPLAGRSEAALADEIMRGALVGEYGLQSMRLALGHDQMNALQRMSGRETLDDLLKMYEPAVREAIIARQQGRKLFAW